MPDGLIWKDSTELEQAFALWHEYSGSTMEQDFRTTCRGIVNIWYSITPPAQGKSADLKASESDSLNYLRGVSAINRDLRGKSGKSAGIFMPLPDDLIDQALATGIYQTENVRLFTRKDGTVFGTDKTHFMPDAGYDEMRAIHNQAFQNGRMSSAGSYTQDIGRWKFTTRYAVRQSSYESYFAQAAKTVGWLASTLNTVAELTGARIPSYARGKNAPQNGKLEIGDEKMHFRYENLVLWADQAADGDMERRLQASLEYQASAMFRRIPYMITSAAKKAGFHVT